MTHVFLYGPHVDRDRIHERVGRCDVHSPAELRGYALCFNKPNLKSRSEGLANLEEAAEDGVHGLIFDLTDKQLETLHGYFGGYVTLSVKVQPKGGGDMMQVTTFIARRNGRNLKPSEETVELTLKGARNAGLPRDYIDSLEKTLKPE